MDNATASGNIDRRSLIAGFFGNVLEWYDFTVYGFFATIIGTQFFPNENKVVQLISAFGVFAAGYLMRPLGGAIFGYIGDRQGRKKALLYSILMMAVPTTLIGFLPTYKDIGWYAALLLVILRLFQGLSVGGEFTGSISFLVERAPKGKRGLWGSWTTFGVFGGMLLGSALAYVISSILTTAELHDYGWRIPFLFGALIGFTGLWLRKGMGADAYDRKLQKEQNNDRTPLSEFWAEHKLVALKIILLTWAFSVAVYLIFIFMPSYLHTFLEIPLDKALASHTIAIVVLMVLIPPFGYLSDKWGRKTVLFISLIGFIVLTYPLFRMFELRNYESILLAMLVFALLDAVFEAVMPALMTESFPAHIRYTGLSVSYNIALALFGGTTPMISTWLVKVSGGNVMMPAYYLIATSVIAIIVALFIPETSKKELD